MPTFPLFQVDAFTTQPFQGNSCVVVFDADHLTADMMQTIAKEMNLAETAFVSKSTKADFKVRYFTPASEIPLAGHPTIATVHALIDAKKLAITKERTKISLELRDGPIQIDIIATPGQAIHITMTQRKPEFFATFDADELAPMFGLGTGDFLRDVPIQIVSTGTRQLMVALQNHDALRRASLNFTTFAKFRQKHKVFSPHLFCLEGISNQGQTFARHLDIPPDLLEDPFTGSATGGMGAYLWKYNLINKSTFIAEQGHWMGRPGQAKVEVIGSRSDITSVRVGGNAVTILRGEISF